MNQFPQQKALRISNQAFEQWGLPKRIKIDNGRPFVNPNSTEIPTLSILWWIGLGIEVVQNRPATPQQNGAVESSQGILFRWANPGQYDNIQALNQALVQQSTIQREIYRIPGKNYQTRMELFPQLTHASRPYQPELFDFKRVERFLAQRAWSRKVKKNGEVKFFGKILYVGSKYVAHQVSITYDPYESIWRFHDSYGTLIKNLDKKIVDPDKIIQFPT